MNELEPYKDQVVERRLAGLEPPSEQAGESTSELLAGVLRRWYIVFLVSVLICGAGIPAIWLLIKPLYSVTGAIQVAPILPNILTGEADDYGGKQVYESFMYTQAAMITSDRVIQRAADNLAGKNLAFFRNEHPKLIEKIKQKLNAAKSDPDPASMLKQAIFDGVITVEPARRTELIQVTMKSTDSAEAKQIVDSFINAYMAVKVSTSAQGEEQKLRVLENESKVLEEKLHSQQKAINQLAQEYGTTTLGSRQDMMLQRVTALLATLTEVEARRINLEAQIQFFEDVNEPAVAMEDLLTMRTEYVNSDPTVQELTRNIVQLEKELIIAKQTLAPGNPTLEQKQQLLDAFRDRLEQQQDQTAKGFDDMMSKETNKAGNQQLLNVQTQLEQAKAYENRLREVLAEEDTQTIELGRKQLTIQNLQFQRELDKEMYDRVLRRIQELEMERKRPARVSVPYNADVSYIRDKRGKYSAALVFFGFACGCGLAFLRDKADKSVRTPADVTKRIGIRIIGTTTKPESIKRKLLGRQMAEDYQVIRTNLGLLEGDGIPRKLVVTSPGVKDGKTTFAVNLATSLARSGKRVLLVDGDLRKPDVALLLDLPKGSRGLQDLIFGAEFSRVVYSIPGSGLDVLAADSHNKSDAYELLTLARTSDQINMLAQAYEHIIIDTPPLLAFPDALLWAKIAGAVVLTSFAGQTTTPDLREAKEKLQLANVKVLGTVLSNVPVGHGYYRYGYGYYDDNGERRRRDRQRDRKLLLPIKNAKDKDNDTTVRGAKTSAS